jgi:hypothetical protein
VTVGEVLPEHPDYWRLHLAFPEQISLPKDFDLLSEMLSIISGQLLGGYQFRKGCLDELLVFPQVEA